MSWSVGCCGRARKVAEVLAVQFSQGTCPEPEQTIKNLVAEQVQLALGAYSPDTVVRVEARGSQSTNTATGGVSNELMVKIEQIYGFVG